MYSSHIYRTGSSQTQICCFTYYLHAWLTSSQITVWVFPQFSIKARKTPWLSAFLLKFPPFDIFLEGFFFCMCYFLLYYISFLFGPQSFFLRRQFENKYDLKICWLSQILVWSCLHFYISRCIQMSSPALINPQTCLLSVGCKWPETDLFWETAARPPALKRPLPAGMWEKMVVFLQEHMDVLEPALQHSI